MTKGILGVIACPMLEDELIYSMSRDPEEKTVYVLETPYNGSLKRKLDANGVPYTLMDEWEFMNTEPALDRGRFNIVVKMKDLALHSEPKVLMQALEDDLTMIQGRVDAVAMYYGMCGNYGMDLTKWAEDNLSVPVTMFRDCNGRVCDDCVGVAVGGLEGYQHLIKDYTGVMLVTPAVAVNWEDFLGASDMAKGLDVMGPGDKREQMRWLLEMCGYTSEVMIDTGLGIVSEKEFEDAARDMSESLNLKILRADPSKYVDHGPMERIYADSKALLQS